MPYHITIAKTQQGFCPIDNETWEFHSKLKPSEIIHADFTKMRNGKFHRKLFALLNLAYEYWEPGEINSDYGKPQKNFDRFRKDLTILAGFYEMNYRLDGTCRPEAKSISFVNMDQEEFERFYNAILDQILKRINVLCNMGRDEINRLVDEVLAFA